MDGGGNQAKSLIIETNSQETVEVWNNTALYHGSPETLNRQARKMVEGIIESFAEAYYIAGNQ
ncbi:MAG: hypothetical protein QM706_08800 [Nitrospira sp.]